MDNFTEININTEVSMKIVLHALNKMCYKFPNDAELGTQLRRICSKYKNTDIKNEGISTDRVC